VAQAHTPPLKVLESRRSHTAVTMDILDLYETSAHEDEEAEDRTKTSGTARFATEGVTGSIGCGSGGSWIEYGDNVGRAGV
jgi:hypothetical protein